jgi:hypothetical protein
VQAIKDAATEKYNTQDRYEVVYTNEFITMFKRYDELVALGYTRAPDDYLIAVNGNLKACQILYMAKPADTQASELQAIYDAIDAEYPITDGDE